MLRPRRRLEEYLGQRVERAPCGLFVGKRKAGAMGDGGRDGAHLGKIGLNCFDKFDELSAGIFSKNCACLLQPALDHHRYPYAVLAKFTAIKEAKLKRMIMEFLSDTSGATAIEYGLIAAGISIAIIVAVNGLGTNLNTMFTSVNNSLK
jgi:pilus assembly protein Flp/PilA